MEGTEIGKYGGTVMGSEGGMENMEDRGRRWQNGKQWEEMAGRGSEGSEI